jgi:chromate transporter
MDLPQANESTISSETVPVLPRQVSFHEAVGFWLKLGFISFGGPAGQIAIMHTELVERRHWISEKRFLHALNYCMLLPGPEAQQLATYIGWLLHRTWGGIVSGTLFVLPSLLMMICLSWIYVRFGDVPVVAALFYGIKPAVAAIVLHAAWRIGSRALRNSWLWSIAVAAFLAVLVFRVPFPVIVIAAAATGFVGGRIAPDRFQAGSQHAASSGTRGPAVIDDTTPPPEHARFRWSRFARVVAVGMLLWLVPMGALLVSFGWDHTLTQMGWFFTKAALLTFGGAYAVLPYVTDGAVNAYGWLTPVQMIDALALGETTPGPLIMLVAFVGFVGAYLQGALGPEALFLAGALAATVVAWFTFLPSFIFILAGGPFVESTQDDLKFTAPLFAITAAVVGVIVNLALFFGYHVLWPGGLSAGLDVVSLAIAAGAAVALFQFKRSVLQVVISCALLGLIVKSLA